jgi:uncharacterized protein (DUF2141 family)
MRTITIAGTIALLLVLQPSPQSYAQGDDARGQLTVHVTGIRSGDGQVRAGIFDSGDGFPLRVDDVAIKADAPIKDGEALIVFDNLPRGTYAVVAYHDENDNGKLDRNRLGKPREGAGIYRRPRSRFPPPRFRNSRFEFRGEDTTVRIDLTYL